MQKISIIGECLKVAQTRGSLAHLRPFLAQNLQKGVFCRIVLIAYSDKWVKSKLNKWILLLMVLQTSDIYKQF